MLRPLSHQIFPAITLSVVGWLLVYNMGGRAIKVAAFGDSDWKIWRLAPNIPFGEYGGLDGIGLKNFLFYLLGKFTFWAGAIWTMVAVVKRFSSLTTPGAESSQNFSPVSGD
jgi:hypothetical protein